MKLIKVVAVVIGLSSSTVWAELHSRELSEEAQIVLIEAKAKMKTHKDAISKICNIDQSGIAAIYEEIEGIRADDTLTRKEKKVLIRELRDKNKDIFKDYRVAKRICYRNHYEELRPIYKALRTVKKACLAKRHGKHYFQHRDYRKAKKTEALETKLLSAECAMALK